MSCEIKRVKVNHVIKSDKDDSYLQIDSAKNLVGLRNTQLFVCERLTTSGSYTPIHSGDKNIFSNELHPINTPFDIIIINDKIIFKSNISIGLTGKAQDKNNILSIRFIDFIHIIRIASDNNKIDIQGEFQERFFRTNLNVSIYFEDATTKIAFIIALAQALCMLFNKKLYLIK